MEMVVLVAVAMLFWQTKNGNEHGEHMYICKCVQLSLCCANAATCVHHVHLAHHCTHMLFKNQTLPAYVYASMYAKMYVCI